MMLISVEKVLVSSIAENGQKSIGDTHAIPQQLNYRDTRCDTEKTSKKYRRYQVLRYFIAILTVLAVPDCPGQSRNGKNVPRPGQVHSGTMKCPGMSRLCFLLYQ